MPMNPRTLRPSSTFTPRSISGLALWLDAADSSTLYTTDAGPVTAVSSPLDIAGCALWLDASDTATITHAGGAVSEWRDKSSGGRHHTASGSARPTTGTRTQNGLNVIDFDGANNLLTGNAASLTMFQNVPHAAVFVVIKFDALTANQYFFEHKATGAAARFQIFTQPGGNLVVGGRRLDADSLVTVASVATTSPSLIAGIADYANSDLFLRAGGATLASTTSFLTDGLTSNTASNGQTLGGVSGLLLDGYIAEVVAYNSSLSPADRARVEAYLAAKWGISGVHAPATATNDPVGAWLDKSGNGRHARQASGGRRASVSSSLTNNRRGVAFAATASTSQQLTTSLPANDSELFTVFCVMREAATPTQGISNRVFLGNVNPGDFYYALNTAGSTSATAHVQLYAEGTYAWLPNPGTTPHIVAVTKTSASQMFLNYDGSLGHMTSNVNAQYATVAAAANRGLARFVNSIGSSANGSQGFTGQILEILAYPIVLSTSERQRVERYLAAKWGIGLAPQVSNADAQDWINRVYVNGGTVSATTANAVNQFCVDIENAGIRGRFYRLNLFAGNSDASLNAVRTPLFRGPSLGGTQYGNATDTNVNFVEGDYAETGASGGLTGNGSTKYLDTGFPMNTLPSTTSGHASVYCRNRSSSNSYRSMIGANHFLSTGFGVSTDAALYSTWGNHAFGVNSTNGLLVATRTSTTSNIAYANGAAVVTNTAAVTPTAISVNATVFAALSAGTPSFHDSRTYGCYSIGTGLTAAEVTSLTNAVNAFQQSLGRA